MSLESLLEKRRDYRDRGLDVVFTNGCFDLVHAGHVHLLRSAREQGDRLIVGLNTDDSIRRIKSADRPILDEEDRQTVLEAFEFVDHVVLFDEDTPRRLIKKVEPDVLVKGADYEKDEIVGARWVEEHGDRVHRVELVEGRGTSEIIQSIRDAEPAAESEDG